MHTEVPGDADNGGCGDGSGHYGDRKSQPEQKIKHKFHFHCFVTCMGILWLYCGLHGCNCGNDYHHYFTMIMMMIIIIIIILQ